MTRVSAIDLVPYSTPIYDNARWEGFESRPGDIFVCTPAKCGTTWTQTIVANLLFPEGDLPAPVMGLSLWIELRPLPVEVMHQMLAGQSHRRVIKSHSPADGIPWLDDAKYVVVGRDGRDGFMSLCNHMERMKFRGEVDDEIAAAPGFADLPDFDGDVRSFFAAWLESRENVPRILSGYWERRSQPNVLLVHYNDLKRDLGAEMRRIADFLGIEVPEALWSGCVERCGFDYMRNHPEMVGDFEAMFEGGTKGFIYKGTNDRWRDVLTDADVAAYERMVAEVLPAEACAWLAGGRRAGPPAPAG